jgi:hypothetical protein
MAAGEADRKSPPMSPVARPAASPAGSPTARPPGIDEGRNNSRSNLGPIWERELSRSPMRSPNPSTEVSPAAAPNSGRIVSPAAIPIPIPNTSAVAMMRGAAGAQSRIRHQSKSRVAS